MRNLYFQQPFTDRFSNDLESTSPMHAAGIPSRLPKGFSTGGFKGGVRSCVLLVALMQGQTIQIIEVNGFKVIYK